MEADKQENDIASQSFCMLLTDDKKALSWSLSSHRLMWASVAPQQQGYKLFVIVGKDASNQRWTLPLKSVFRRTETRIESITNLARTT